MVSLNALNKITTDKCFKQMLYLYTKVILGYTKNNRVKDALQLFYEMPIRDIISWNSMTKGCFNCGDLAMAKKVFERIPEKDVISGQQPLIGLFQHGRVENAEILYLQMPSRDIAGWNSMIYGYISIIELQMLSSYLR